VSLQETLDRLALTVTPAVLDDAERVFDLEAAVDTHDFGDVDFTVDDIRDELEASDLAADTWLVSRADAPRGALIARALLEPRGGVEYRGQVAVHPEWRGRGIGSALARELEEGVRRRKPAGNAAEWPLLGFIQADQPGLTRWTERLGYAWSRRFLRMRIELNAPPPEPQWPAGITVRDFVLGQDERPLHDALDAAFTDHWGHVARPPEDLVARTQRSDFDPGLWHVAVEDGQIVATATNSTLPDGVGWVSGLGVIPSHRRRGLARAILLHSFGVFWRRGMTAVALGVDAESLTGATRLYESVGMRTVLAWDQVRKVVPWVGYSSTE
jgi:mycothiol synthase